MVYSWKYQQPVTAQVAGEYMEDVAKRHGQLTPSILLEESRPTDSVMHKCFEWDDTKAAEKYRLTQASTVIRSLTVTIETNNAEPPKSVRAFVNVVQDAGINDQGQYIPVTVALNSAVSREIVLQNALNELNTFKTKYNDLMELTAVFADITMLTEKYLHSRKQKTKKPLAVRQTAVAV